MTGGDVRSAVAQALHGAGVRHRSFAWIDLVRGEVAGDARALLVFLDGAQMPEVLVKLGSGPERRRALVEEHANLQRLEAGSAVLRRAVPRALYLGEAGAYGVLAQTAVPGTRMKDLPPAAYFGSRAFDEHLRELLSWLEALHALPGLPTVGQLDAVTEIERYRRGFAASPALARLLDETAATLSATNVPASPCHGDFCTANVLIAADGGLRVIDWELPLARSWPLADLLYFASSVWTLPRGRDAEVREANFRNLHFGGDPLARRVRETVRELARHLGLAAEQILPLTVLAWASFANRKRAALAPLMDDPGGPLPDDVAAAHFPLVLVRHGYCRNLELLAEGRDHGLWNA